jgi:hypothetical protein
MPSSYAQKIPSRCDLVQVQQLPGVPRRAESRTNFHELTHDLVNECKRGLVSDALIARHVGVLQWLAQMLVTDAGNVAKHAVVVRSTARVITLFPLLHEALCAPVGITDLVAGRTDQSGELGLGQLQALPDSTQPDAEGILGQRHG